MYSEKVVAKNCAINRNENFTLDDLKIIISKNVYPNLYTLLKVAIVLPISSASCERSFSAMRRIKTRSTMEQSRFTNISFLHIERDIIIDSEQVLNIFSLKDRMLSLS